MRSRPACAPRGRVAAHVGSSCVGRRGAAAGSLGRRGAARGGAPCRVVVAERTGLDEEPSHLPGRGAGVETCGGGEDRTTRGREGGAEVGSQRRARGAGRSRPRVGERASRVAICRAWGLAWYLREARFHRKPSCEIWPSGCTQAQRGVSSGGGSDGWLQGWLMEGQAQEATRPMLQWLGCVAGLWWQGCPQAAANGDVA